MKITIETDNRKLVLNSEILLTKVDRFPKTVAMLVLMMGAGSIYVEFAYSYVPLVETIQPALLIGGFSMISASFLLGIRAFGVDSGKS